MNAGDSNSDTNNGSSARGDTRLSVAARVKRLSPLLLAIYLPAVFLIVMALGAYLVADVPIRYFFIDPVAEFNAPMYIGLLSNFGVVLWCSSASVCLLGSYLLFPDIGKREESRFLLCSGLITALLMLDDLYLLHEEVLPDHLYVPQPLVFVGYGAIILSYFARFRAIIFRTEYFLLAIALVFFAMSVFVDLFITPGELELFGAVPGRHLVEDGFKLLGIVTWAAYLIKTCIELVRPAYRPA